MFRLYILTYDSQGEGSIDSCIKTSTTDICHVERVIEDAHRQVGSYWNIIDCYVIACGEIVFKSCSSRSIRVELYNSSHSSRSCDPPEGLNSLIPRAYHTVHGDVCCVLRRSDDGRTLISSRRISGGYKQSEAVSSFKAQCYNYQQSYSYRSRHRLLTLLGVKWELVFEIYCRRVHSRDGYEF